MAERVHSDESAGFQVGRSGPNCAEHEIADDYGRDVLRADLNDARFIGAHCIDAFGNPNRAQVHIDQQFHAAGSDSSISSTRQAA